MKEAGVGGGEIVVLKFASADPFKVGAAEGLGFVSQPLASIESEVNGFVGIGVSQAFNKLTDQNVDSEFFAQFADQALFEGFMRFAFAAGEFP